MSDKREYIETGVKRTDDGGMFCESCGADLSSDDSVEVVCHWDGEKEYGYNFKCTKCGGAISLTLKRTEEEIALHGCGAYDEEADE